jgi:hypothetical protein
MSGARDLAVDTQAEWQRPRRLRYRPLLVMTP